MGEPRRAGDAASTTQVFREKPGSGLILLIVACTAHAVVLTRHSVRFALAPGPDWIAAVSWLMVGAAPLLILLAWWAVLSSSIELTAWELVIRRGPHRKRIAFGAVTSLSPAPPSRFGGGLFPNQLRVSYLDARGKRRAVRVNPGDVIAFSAALAAACQSLQRS